MRRRFAATLATLLLAALLLAGPVPGGQAGAQSTAVVPATAAASVVLDVVVQDSDGHPVRGLKPEDFRLTEGGVAQTLVHVEEHRSSTFATPAVVALPAGTFTDYTPITPGSPLNILVIDALNTPIKDLAFFRYELLQFVKQADPKQRIAIVGLANRPIVLQGLVSNPAVLRDVLERKLIERRSSPAAAEAATSNEAPSSIELAANLREFESELPAMETQLREHYTLDAFNTLAHYLAGFPGRKNLLWFSGSFPLHLAPEPSPAKALPAEASEIDQAELRETVNLLSKARVAVYPIDARGLMNQPGTKLKSQDAADEMQAHRFSAELNKFPQTEAAEHASMQALAAGTGGLAFDTVGNFADTVSRALASAADFYTLSYTPTNRDRDGAYRTRHVELAGATAAQLLYRRGYYAPATADEPSPSKADAAQPPSAQDGRAAAYKQAAMSRGAPDPVDLLFKVRILPASATTETSAAPDTQLALGVPTDGPFRRYELDYISLPGELEFVQQPDGKRMAKVEFLAYAFSTEGRLLSATGKNVSFEATAANFARLMHGVIRCHVELSVPDRAEAFLRLGVRDASTNKFGVIEVPASSVSSLPPASESPAPAAGRATPPQD